MLAFCSVQLFQSGEAANQLVEVWSLFVTASSASSGDFGDDASASSSTIDGQRATLVRDVSAAFAVMCCKTGGTCGTLTGPPRVGIARGVKRQQKKTVGPYITPLYALQSMQEIERRTAEAAISKAKLGILLDLLVSVRLIRPIHLGNELYWQRRHSGL